MKNYPEEPYREDYETEEEYMEDLCSRQKKEENTSEEVTSQQ